ncbi:hypothetical protein Taro_025510 [Colocasia esculenta]|uniref:DYW domain-containing protein n=1 Tax=Colocasia esculenta TaxID=4460 RepID=A0A843VAD3_COLES|nr:hypothetical protein [Colocasia esculenta]
MIRRRSGCAFLCSLLNSRRLARSFSVPIAAAATSPPCAAKPRRIPTFLREHDSSGAHPDPRRTQVPAAALCAEGRFQGAVDALFRQRGRVCDAIRLLDDFEGQPVPPAVYLNLFRLCLDQCALDEARRVYEHAVSWEFHPDILVANRLIAMFAKSGCTVSARHVFDHMPARDACSWNTVIAGYAKGGDMAEARLLFDEMPREMKDSFSWSTMMSGYVRHDRPAEALRLYGKMQMSGKSGCNNKFTVSSALAASAAVLSRRFGKEIHGHIIRGELTSDAVVWSALSDMYAKCGAIVEARHIFDGTPDRDVVSWSAIIGRYFDAGRSEDGLGLFSKMLRSGVRPNEFTFAGVLNACSERTMEGVGKQVHGHMMRIGWDPFSFAAGALIDMYSKCGNIESAKNVFEGMPQPDLVSWTSMISGLAQNGYPEEALRYFESLLKSGTKPDHITFVGVLSACTHAGLVDKGLEIFHSIEKEHGLVHSNDHYACVVDLLSRAGRFEEVEELISKMPMKPDKFLWASLLGGCRIHKNLRLARLAADALFEVEPENAATYVTLANIYATAGLWEDVSKVRKMMDDRRVVKKPGSSWIEVGRKVHRFLVGDESHPRIKEIHVKLDKLSARMKEEGYVPDTIFVLHDIEEEQKEQNLVHHSEKLAVAFGIIATPPQTSIKVFKNLRICGDCHTAIKFISRIAEREIIVRDSSRFHHFKHGRCSCKDYW